MIVLAVLMIDFSVSFRINPEKTQVIRAAEPESRLMTIWDMAKHLFTSHAITTDHQPKGESLDFPHGIVIKEGEGTEFELNRSIKKTVTVFLPNDRYHRAYFQDIVGP